MNGLGSGRYRSKIYRVRSAEKRKSGQRREGRAAMRLRHGGKASRPPDPPRAAQRALRIVGNALHFRAAAGQHDLPPGGGVEAHAGQRGVHLHHDLVEPLADHRHQSSAGDLAAVGIGTGALSRNGDVAMGGGDLYHVAEIATVLHGGPIEAFDPLRLARSEERRGGKEGVSTCSSRWSPSRKKKKTKQ